MLRLAFDFIITWRETRTRPNAYLHEMHKHNEMCISDNMRCTSQAYNLYCFRKRSKEIQTERRYC